MILYYFEFQVLT